MLIKQISAEATLEIRHKVLWPNKPKEFCLVDGDESAVHCGVHSHEILVGVASVYDNDGVVRLRKFAVDTDYQGKGLGTALINYVIRSVQSGGASVFWCDARQSAQEFYERFGLCVEGEKFYKSDVPYYKMSINFNPISTEKTKELKN